MLIFVRHQWTFNHLTKEIKAAYTYYRSFPDSRMLTFWAFLHWKFKGDIITQAAQLLTYFQDVIFLRLHWQFNLTKKIFINMLLTHFQMLNLGVFIESPNEVFIKCLCCLRISSMLIFVRYQWKFNRLTKEIQAASTIPGC